jgi:chromosome partition protein MukE
MSGSKFPTLGDAVLDDAFPDVDLALRRGRHVDRDDAAWFGFLSDAADVLEPFYRRFGAELVYRADGFYYLLPTGEKLATRQLSVAEMLVGQTLTLLYLDPSSVENGGRVTRERLLSHLATVMGTDALMRALNPKRRRYDERVAHETVRSKVSDAIRRLSVLGFVELEGAEELRLRPALLRFAEPVRNSADSAESLARLVASGEVALSPLDSVPEGEDAAPGELDDDFEADSADGTDFDGDTDTEVDAEIDAEGDADAGADERDGDEPAVPVDGLPLAALAAETLDFGFEDADREGENLVARFARKDPPLEGSE